MTYRDELDATRARLAALERELADANQELDELRGKRSQALVRAGEHGLVLHQPGQAAARTWLGAPTRLTVSQVVPGQLDDSWFPELVECIRSHSGDVGSHSILPGSLAWSANAHVKATGPFLSVTVTGRDGQITIRVDERLANTAGAIFGGVGGGVGGGGMALPAALIILAGPVGGLMIPLWLGGVYIACRRLYQRAARRRAESMQSLLEQLVAIVSKRAGS